MITNKLPNVKLIFITPFYCGAKNNPKLNMKKCADVFIEFANEYNLIVYNMNKDYGYYFLNNNYFVKDNVHLNRKGYIEFGNIVADYILNGQLHPPKGWSFLAEIYMKILINIKKIYYIKKNP